MKIAILFCLLISISLQKSLYNVMFSYVLPITKLNFEGQVTKLRQTTRLPTLIHFQKDDGIQYAFRQLDGVSAAFSKEYDAQATENKGIFRLASVDCYEEREICRKEKITNQPTLRVYPPLPLPPEDITQGITMKAAVNLVTKYLQDNVIPITGANIDSFINDKPTVPKVMLFTKSKTVPYIYKSLSLNFEKTMFFGIVQSDEEKALMERFNIKSAPKIIVVKTTEKKPYYQNGEIKFQSIFDFLNIFSEVYVPGGGTQKEGAAAKEWLREIVPEMTYQSANDICLKVEGAICVILITKGKPEEHPIGVLKSLHKDYERRIDRGIVFKFMWLDSVQEVEWSKVFQLEKYPSVVMFNPGKRKRYFLHPGELTVEDLSIKSNRFWTIQETSLEKVLGGDAKYINIKTDLPELVFRKDYL